MPALLRDAPPRAEGRRTLGRRLTGMDSLRGPGLRSADRSPVRGAATGGSGYRDPPGVPCRPNPLGSSLSGHAAGASPGGVCGTKARARRGRPLGSPASWPASLRVGEPERSVGPGLEPGAGPAAVVSFP